MGWYWKDAQNRSVLRRGTKVDIDGIFQNLPAMFELADL